MIKIYNLFSKYKKLNFDYFFKINIKVLKNLIA